MSNTELKVKGYEILSKYMGLMDMEKFISLVQQDKFDYTEWHKNLFEGLAGEEISKMAMGYVNNESNA